MCIRDRLKGRESVNVPFIVVAVGWKPATGPLPGVVANEPVPDRVPPVQLKIPVALLLGMTILPVPVSVPLLKFSVGRVVVAAPSRLSVPPVMFSVFAAKVPVSEVAPLLTFSVPVPVTPPLCTSSAPSVLIPVSVVPVPPAGALATNEASVKLPLVLDSAIDAIGKPPTAAFRVRLP